VSPSPPPLSYLLPHDTAPTLIHFLAKICREASSSSMPRRTPPPCTAPAALPRLLWTRSKWRFTQSSSPCPPEARRGIAFDRSPPDRRRR
jgi:hypothetical protein